MMRKVAVLSVLGLVCATSAYALSVHVTPMAQTVMVSSLFTIDIVVTDAGSPGVEVVDVVALFNPADAEAVGASEGSFLGGQQVGEDLLEFLEINNVSGMLSYTVVRLGPVSSYGSGTAARLTFHCLQVSSLYIEVSTLLIDTQGEALGFWVDIPVVTQTPEPATLVLIGAALTVAGVIARRRTR